MTRRSFLPSVVAALAAWLGLAPKTRAGALQGKAVTAECRFYPSIIGACPPASPEARLAMRVAIGNAMWQTEEEWFLDCRGPIVKIKELGGRYEERTWEEDDYERVITEGFLEVPEGFPFSVDVFRPFVTERPDVAKILGHPATRRQITCRLSGDKRRLDFRIVCFERETWPKKIREARDLYRA